MYFWVIDRCLSHSAVVVVLVCGLEICEHENTWEKKSENKKLPAVSMTIC